MSGPSEYIGRFAPSPSGPLHFGSLVAAVASYLQARSAGGQWLVRIEDIDPPREQPGAISVILQTLAAYGFEWDGDVEYQSHNRERHLQVVEQLLQQNLAYRCSCSRRDLAEAERGPLGIIYPGTCRNGCSGDDYAIRLLTDDHSVHFDDVLQGRVSQQLETESGDFVILRRDGLIAYNLAVVVDDADSGVTEVVRGIDLLDSTPRHIYLQRLLELPVPAYAHIPVVENPDGQKLSKLTGAPGIPDDRPREWLLHSLSALRQEPPLELQDADLESIWSWAIRHWQPAVLTGLKSIADNASPLAEPRNGLR